MNTDKFVEVARQITHGDINRCWDWPTDQKFQHVKNAYCKSFEYFHGPIPMIENSGWHGTVIMHSCNNGRCINPYHLSAGTQAENLAYMRMQGRDNTARGDKSGSRTCPESRPRGDNHYARTQPELLARGDRSGRHTKPRSFDQADENIKGLGNPAVKLTLEQYKAIEEFIKTSTLEQRDIAKIFGVSQSLISKLHRNSHWSQRPSLPLSH